MDTDINRDDSPKGKKSSILKASKPRLPLQDVNLGSNVEEDTTETRRRRVSFSSVNQIKKFNANAESLLVSGTLAYEEHFPELSSESPNIQEVLAPDVRKENIENSSMKTIEVLSSPVSVSSSEEDMSVCQVVDHLPGYDPLNHVPLIMGQVPNTPGVWSLDRSVNITNTDQQGLFPVPGSFPNTPNHENMSFTCPLNFPAIMNSQNTMDFTTSVNPASQNTGLTSNLTKNFFAHSSLSMNLQPVTPVDQQSMEFSLPITSTVPLQHISQASDVQITNVVNGPLPYNYSLLPNFTGVAGTEKVDSLVDLEVPVVCSNEDIVNIRNKELSTCSVVDSNTDQVNGVVEMIKPTSDYLNPSNYQYQSTETVPQTSKETKMCTPFKESGSSMEGSVSMELSVVCTAKESNFDKSGEVSMCIDSYQVPINQDQCLETGIQLQQDEPAVKLMPAVMESNLIDETECAIGKVETDTDHENQQFEEPENKDVMPSPDTDYFIQDADVSELSKICSVDDSDLEVTLGEACADVVTASTIETHPQECEVPAAESPTVELVDMDIKISVPINNIRSETVPVFDNCENKSVVETCEATENIPPLRQTSITLDQSPVGNKTCEKIHDSPPKRSDSELMELSDCAEKVTNIIDEPLPMDPGFNSPAFKKTKVSLAHGWTCELEGTMEITEAIDCTKPCPPYCPPSPENSQVSNVSSNKRKSIALRQSILPPYVSKLPENVVDDTISEKSQLLRRASILDCPAPPPCNLTIPSFESTGVIDRSELSLTHNYTFGIVNPQVLSQLPSANVGSPAHSESECPPVEPGEILQTIPGIPTTGDKNANMDNSVILSYKSSEPSSSIAQVKEETASSVQVDVSLPLPVFTVDNPMSPDQREECNEPEIVMGLEKDLRSDHLTESHDVEAAYKNPPLAPEVPVSELSENVGSSLAGLESEHSPNKVAATDIPTCPQSFPTENNSPCIDEMVIIDMSAKAECKTVYLRDDPVCPSPQKVLPITVMVAEEEPISDQSKTSQDTTSYELCVPVDNQPRELTSQGERKDTLGDESQPMSPLPHNSPKVCHSPKELPPMVETVPENESVCDHSNTSQGMVMDNEIHVPVEHQPRDFTNGHDNKDIIHIGGSRPISVSSQDNPACVRPQEVPAMEEMEHEPICDQPNASQDVKMSNSRCVPVEQMSELSINNKIPGDMEWEEPCDEVCDTNSVPVSSNPSDDLESEKVSKVYYKIPAIQSLINLKNSLALSQSRFSEGAQSIRGSRISTQLLNSSSSHQEFVTVLPKYTSSDGKLLSAQKSFSNLMKLNGFTWKETQLGGLWIKGFMFNYLALAILIETPDDINVIKTRSALRQLPISFSNLCISKRLDDEIMRFMLKDLIDSKETWLVDKLKCFDDIREVVDVISKSTEVLMSVWNALYLIDYLRINTSFLNGCFIFPVVCIGFQVEFEVHISLQNIKLGLDGVELKVIKLDGPGDITADDVYSVYNKIPNDENKFVSLFRELSYLQRC